MALHDISQLAGAPPLLWSNVKEAFDKINQNFTTLAASSGNGDLVDFTSLETDVSPSNGGSFKLGSLTQSWKQLYISEYLDVPGSADNGIWIGDSQIKGFDGIVDLPLNSTVNGSLIIDPNRIGFRTVEVPGQTDVVANNLTSSLKLQATPGILITTDAISDIITFQNTGVVNIQGTDGEIGVSGSNNLLTLTNLGVKSVSAGAAVSGRTAGAGISVSGNKGDVTITNTGILGVQAGIGITISTDSATGVVTVSNSAPASAAAAFSNIAVTGTSTSQETINADIIGDTVTFDAGYGILLTTDPITDTMTFAVDLDILSISELTNGTYTLSVGAGGVISLGSTLGKMFADQSTGEIVIADFLSPEGQPAMPSSAVYIGGDDAFRISRGQSMGNGLNPFWRFGSDGILYLSATGDGTGGGILRGPLNTSVGIAAYNDTGAGTTYTLSVASTGQINLPTASDGKARLQNANGVEILSDTAMWAFNTTGALNLPGDTGFLYSVSDEVYLNSDANGYNSIDIITNGDTVLRNQRDVKIIADSDGSGHTWVFGRNGELTLPGAIHGGSSAVTLKAVNPLNPLQTKSWSFDGLGKITFPDATVQTTAYTAPTTVTKTPGPTNEMNFAVTAVDGSGNVTEITVTNSPNTNWTSGTGGAYGDIYFTVNIDGSGNATVVVTGSGAGHNTSETFTLSALSFGATDESIVAIDVSKTINKLAAGMSYTLADGVEGQIMYLVMQDGTDPADVRVTVSNARFNGGTNTGWPLYPFIQFTNPNTASRDICTLIFTDGHWQQIGGLWD